MCSKVSNFLEQLKRKANFQESKDTLFPDEMKLSTLYLKMVKVYFRLVDKIEENLNLSSWRKFQVLFQTEIEAILKKLINVNELQEKAEIGIRFYDSMSNAFDLDEFAKEYGKADDWDVSKFLRDSGVVFNISFQLKNITSLIQKNALSKPLHSE